MGFKKYLKRVRWKWMLFHPGETKQLVVAVEDALTVVREKLRAMAHEDQDVLRLLMAWDNLRDKVLK